MYHKITTYEALLDAISADAAEHELKSIATLFQIAMTDWPNEKRLDIAGFLVEFKQFAGDPVTIAGIKNARDPSGTWWRHEAGAGMIELIQRAEALWGETDVDRIVARILDYYENRIKS
jgi:hypothetical protein